ncbi:MAG TPA: hypothetical protein VFU82_03555 [Gammaproteobacteria bacterium]|nr:hypothetical protein [Gammaproteobacteria bacterium]
MITGQNTALKNINLFSVEQKQMLMENIYTHNSYFNSLFHCDHTTFNTALESQTLRNAVSNFLVNRQLIPANTPLETIHEHLTEEMRAYNFNDGVNKISTTLYEQNDEIQAAYLMLIKKLRTSFLNEAFYFQATPTIRIHCPNSLNSHHYPRYHSDISYGHPPEEINIWLPLTEIKTGHGFKLLNVSDSRNLLKNYDYNFESFINDAIHNPNLTQQCENHAFNVNANLGELFAFDSRCIHSGEPLKSHTRISLDIRILPVSRFDEMDIEYQGSGRRKILFTPGHCYHHLNSDQLLNTEGLSS